jgi:membrane-associated phospholipid phosphatase
VSVATFVGLSALAWHATAPMRWELRFISLARRIPPPGALSWERAFQAKPFAVITIVLVLIALVERRPVLALAGAAGCFLSVFTAEYVLKPIINSRQQVHHYRWWHPTIGPLTFPSGHVTAAAAVATFAWLILYPRTKLAVVVFAVPAIVAWAMISLDLHSPLDALGGVVLGPLVVFASVAYASWISDRARPSSAVTTAGRRAEPDPTGSS